METVFEVSIITGTVLIALALCWLIMLAFMQNAAWGVAVMFFLPVLLPWHIFQGRPKTKWPTLVLALGFGGLAFPVLYTRIMPVDLGPHIHIVDGEKHITLTGWDRHDYHGLRDHPDVVVLQMANLDVTDADVANIAGFQKLRELDISGTYTSDESLPTLMSLPKLERLRISQTLITDPGFEFTLSKHPALKQVWCEHTGIDGQVLEIWKRGGEGRRYVGGVVTQH